MKDLIKIYKIILLVCLNINIKKHANKLINYNILPYAVLIRLVL